MVEILKIPAERVGALIGPEGEYKKRLEKLTNTTIKVNDEGEVEIRGESANEFFVKDVIRAVGRGFSVKDAEALLRENFSLQVIDLKEYCANEKDLYRVRARIIGKEGKMKSEIEAATDSKVSVYGWTVSIIAPLDSIGYAKKAIEKILNGSQLTTVFNDLAKYKREIMSNRLLGK